MTMKLKKGDWVRLLGEDWLTYSGVELGDVVEVHKVDPDGQAWAKTPAVGSLTDYTGDMYESYGIEKVTPRDGSTLDLEVGDRVVLTGQNWASSRGQKARVTEVTQGQGIAVVEDGDESIYVLLWNGENRTKAGFEVLKLGITEATVYVKKVSLWVPRMDGAEEAAALIAEHLSAIADMLNIPLNITTENI